MESSGGKRLTKKPHKEKMKAQKKEKISENIVLDKEDKGFDAKECLVVKTIGEEYDVCFSFGTTLVPIVEIEVHGFKQSPPNIMYMLLSNVHVGEIFFFFVKYSKYDMKVSIFAIPEDLKNLNYILPCEAKSWKEIEYHQFFIIGGEHTITATLVNFLLHFII
jgi:hypothetical protein